MIRWKFFELLEIASVDIVEVIEQLDLPRLRAFERVLFEYARPGTAIITTPNKDAFDILHYIARKRLAAGRLTVVDAINVQLEARLPLIQLAREFHVISVAIVLDLPERLCTERNRHRPDRDFSHHVIHRQRTDLRHSLRGLEKEGFRHIFVLESADEIAEVTITRFPSGMTGAMNTGLLTSSEISTDAATSSKSCC